MKALRISAKIVSSFILMDVILFQPAIHRWYIQTFNLPGDEYAYWFAFSQLLLVMGCLAVIIGIWIDEIPSKKK